MKTIATAILLLALTGCGAQDEGTPTSEGPISSDKDLYTKVHEEAPSLSKVSDQQLSRYMDKICAQKEEWEAGSIAAPPRLKGATDEDLGYLVGLTLGSERCT
jgi:hypothetical protein